MSTDLQQYLRLEVERDPDPGELINLIPNPDGALGAWGWVTPVDGATMRANQTSGIRFLTYQSPGGVPSYFHSVPMPVEAGQWIASRFMAIAVNGQYRATVEWLDVDGDVIGSTTQSAAFTASSTARAYGSFQAPVGTFYARLRFDHYNSSGGNPDFGVLSLREIVLTAGDTAGELGWTRTNLVRNPSAEAATTYWSAENGVLDTSSLHAWAGAKSFRVTKGDGKTGPMVALTTLDVTAGRDYALQARSRPSTVARQVTVAARWLDADGQQISQATARVGTEAVGIWTVPLSGVVTAPTTAAQLQLRIVWAQVPEGERHLFDAVMVEQASTVGAYFDGSTADAFGVTHAWTGATGLSTSTETGPTGDPGVLVPVPYQNILGPTSQITVDREDLNVGSMSVKLFDAVLDPTQSDLIQMGRRIRLLAMPPAVDDETPDPEVLFAGKIFTGSVAYHLLHPNEAKRAEVTLTAVDPINPLASTPSREGVATIADLPHVLEAAGVPWSVNGNGNQVADPEIVAYNDNASALDQVAVTRDSALGYAWVDRNGVLQAWDRAELDSTVAAELDESTYTADLDVDFDLDSLINSVTVKVLRVIATTGATEEVPFGPYVHAESYRRYGEHAQEFVVQGFDASDTAAIQDYAEAILDANALPRLRVNELVMPIASDRIEEPNLDHALLDLYDLVTVINERASVDEAARVRRIHHEITATKSGGTWTTTLGFTADGSVAPSTAVPAPPPGVGQVLDDIQPDIDQSLQDAANALDLATAKQQRFRQPTMPPGGTYVIGDIWFDSDDNDKQYRWNGSAWVVSTGAWLVTNPSSQFPNMVISPAGLAGYDASGNVKVSIDAATGQLVTNGAIFTSADISGSTVTGGTVQSEATVNRGVKFNSAGLVAYDAGGSPTFVITGSTGAVTMKGALTSGSTVVGAQVATSSSGKRVELSSSNNDIRFYDSTGTQRGLVDYINWVSGGHSLTLRGPSSSQEIRLHSSSTQLIGDINVQGNLTVSGSYPSSGSSWVGSATSNLDMNGHSIIDVSSVSTGGVSSSGAMIDSSLAGTFADASINTNGRAVRTTSTERVKKDITPVDFDEATVLAMQEVTHRYIDEEIYGDTVFVGLIAEQLIACGMGEFVFYDQDGLPEGIHYTKLVVPLLNVVRKHRTELNDLLERVEALEGP